MGLLMIDPDELDNEFRFHPPMTAERGQAHEAVRSSCAQLARLLNQLVPDGFEKDQAIRVNLIQVMFWSNAGIARQPDGGGS
jgi:hypothetical protein